MAPVSIEVKPRMESLYRMAASASSFLVIVKGHAAEKKDEGLAAICREFTDDFLRQLGALEMECADRAGKRGDGSVSGIAVLILAAIWVVFLGQCILRDFGINLDLDMTALVSGWAVITVFFLKFVFISATRKGIKK